MKGITIKQVNDFIDTKKESSLTKENLLPTTLKKPGHYTSRNESTRLHINNLFSELVEMVSLKQFKKAEALRKKIFEIDSMATNEIVKSGILIENEKRKYQLEKPLHVLIQSEKAFTDSSLTDSTCSKIFKAADTTNKNQESVLLPNNWENLYRSMSPDEINIFTSILKPVATKSSKTLIKQRMLNNNLYFINSGQAKVVGITNGGISFKKTLNPGDIAGEDVFFSNTPSLVSVIAAKGAGINYIRKNDLYQLCSLYPSIGKSLFDYCNKKGKTTAKLHSSGLNQRSENRIIASGTADLQLMNEGAVNLGKPFNGKILDISRGGISLAINKIKPELARKFFNMKVNLLLNLNNLKTPILCSGNITGVHRKSPNAYTLHLQWDKANEKISSTINWLANQ